MKLTAAWIFVAIWFYHLIVGIGSWAAAYRIWPERQNKFVRYTMYHLHAAVFDALGAIVCVFLAKDVRLTWKFSIAMFAFIFIRDSVRLPLVLYILRGPRKREARPIP